MAGGWPAAGPRPPRAPGPGRLAVDVSVKVRPGAAAVGVGPGGRVRVHGGAGGEGEEFRYAVHALGGSDQRGAFRALALPMVRRLRDGFDCTMMAYGQTGSGKTYTMLGEEGSLTEASLEARGASACAGGESAPEAWGLFPRVMLELLASAEAGAGNVRASLHASVIEIYQEGCYDLLADKKPLRVGKSAALSHEGMPKCAPTNRQTGNVSAMTGLNGAHKPGCGCRNCWMARKKDVADRLAKRDAIQASRGRGRAAAGASNSAASSRSGGGGESFKTIGETLWEVKSAGDVARLARLVEANRSSRSHNLNERSSRSHCIVRASLTQRGSGKVRGGSQTSTFQFVDLAGSERIKKSEVAGAGRQEAIKINKSLTALGRVVKALAGKETHVPYRESLLTVLLRDSLSGQSVMGVVICVASEPSHVEETLCSLRYGARMARVKSTPVAAVESNTEEEEAFMKESLLVVQAELLDLKARGLGGRFGAGAVLSERKAFNSNVERLGKAEAKVAQYREDLLEVNARTSSSSSKRDATSRALREAQFEASNLRDIVLRQKSVKNFWIEPTPGYVKKAAEAREIESKLLLL